ncbi:MAG: hypothetical protein WD603_02235 [Patescibacteria group bacterium]
MHDPLWNRGGGTPVSRRVLFGFGGTRGELVVSVTPGQPIPHLGNISERMMLEATVTASEAKPGQTVYPQFVFGTAVEENGTSIVYGPDHRAIPILRFTAEQNDGETLDYAERLEQTKAALPPAPAMPNEGVIGFLVRTDVLHFYPLVRIPEDEHGHFLDGDGSTDDLIQALPYQA